MSTLSLRSLQSFCALASLLAATGYAQPSPTVRITQAVDNNVRITLRGNTHPLARPEFDQGEAPDDLPMKRMLLVLKRSPEQESALLSVLDNQQDKHSPSYHKWLAPKEFGTRFGPSDSDMAAVTNWLKSSGFEVAKPSAGRTVIEFSGTASQVQAAFHAPIHKFVVNGKQHWANANDPQIPAALEPVVAGVHSLHNFLKQPQVALQKEVPATFTKNPAPQVTFKDGTHALGPADYARIYNFPTSGTGAGFTIGVVARAEYDLQDLFDFYFAFGLSRNPPTAIVDGDDPGNLGGNELLEATLDATWSSILAPGANVISVVSSSTNTTDGVDLSEIYIVDHNLADVMTESFGSCEAAHSMTEAQNAQNLAEQAAAEGITYIVSAGDSGAEGCDRPTFPAAQGPVSASLLSATPFNIAVGGTMFSEGSQPSKYWGSSPPLAETALSHIPENVWNESCSTATCGSNAALWAGGGGASTFFAKPSWQSGVTGIPNDGARDQPDVSLTAAGHDPYLLCLNGRCQAGFINFVFGTSAAAPSFAAIMALVDEKTGSRQGQADYVLYRLAAADIAAGRKCNGSGATLPASTCTFNDVTVGNNAVPGEVGFGTPSAQYQSTAGYDLATGLGSVNVTNLLNNWASAIFTPTSTTLVSVTPTVLTHGAPVNVQVTVTPNTATGKVLLQGNVSGVSAAALIDTFPLNAGSVVGTTTLLPGGGYQVRAHYGGDSTFAPSDSPTPGINVFVNPEPSSTALGVFNVDSAFNLVPYGTQPFGSVAFLRADVSGSSGFGVPSRSLTFGDNGTPLGSGFLDSKGTATTPAGIANFAVGPHSIIASYGGDNSFNGSFSPATNITVTKATATGTLSSSSATVAEGVAVTFTDTFATTSFASAGPSGNVAFFDSGTPISNGAGPIQPTPGSVNLETGASTKAGGIATLSTTLPAGTHSITAQYPGDGNYLASTSAPINVNVAADFDFTPTTAPITVSRGSSGTTTFTIAGHTGYNSTVNFAATSCTGLPTESSCSFAPPSVVGSGTTVLTIKTTAPKTADLRPLNFWATGSAGIFAALFLLGTSSRRRCRSALLALLLFASLTTLIGCGGGGNSGPPPDPGTPLGTFTVTVKAGDSTGVLSHTALVTLKVQ